MAGKVKPIPDGYHAVTPYMSVAGAADAIEFYKQAFGAKELMRMPGPNGTIGHAEIEIGGSRIMLADEHPEMHFRGPKSFGGTAVHIQFYGDRLGSLEDPFGHVWHVSTHKEDLSMEELKKRAAAASHKA